MVTCIIPARGGSIRIPRKNIKDFHGKPIIAYSIQTAQQVCDRVVVSTEDDDIAAVAKMYGADVYMRPERLARDDVGTQEVMADACESVVEMGMTTAVCLYPCAPLVTPRDLMLAIQQCMLRPCMYVVSVAANPLRDIGNFYVGPSSAFVNGEPLYGTHTGIYVMPTERAIDINTPADWEMAEDMYRGITHE